MAWLFFPLNVFSAGFAERGGVLEVAIIFLVVYPALRLLRVARAASIAVGIAVFAVLYWLAATLGPTTLGVVCRGGLLFFAFVFFGLFRTEIRRNRMGFV